jgi:very-short-patch-repair endonuclease
LSTPGSPSSSLSTDGCSGVLLTAPALPRWTAMDEDAGGAPTEETLEDVLRRQCGVIRPADVARWLAPDEIRAEVAEGRWSHPHRGVYVTQNRDLSVDQERWVCLLAGPRGSALGGLTAAAIDGLTGFEVPLTFLVIPAGYRKPRRDGLVVQRTTRLTDADVHPTRVPRRTRLPRSLVDGASWSRRERTARAVILAGVQQRLVRPDDLRDALLRTGPCRHRALITESISDAEGGVASVPEHDFEIIRRRFHLPRPDRQAVVRRSDGRYYLDGYWHRYRLGVEIHGLQHLAVPSWDADLDRHTELTADGRAILQFSSYSVRHRKDHVGALVTRALRRRGWTE